VVSEYNSSPLFKDLSALPVEQWYNILLQRFAEQQEVVDPVIIDNSKKVRWVRRVAKRVPARAARVLAGDWANVFIYKWLRENRQISRFLAKNDYPHVTVSYHDMVFDTEPMLQRLMPRLGLVYEPGQLMFGEGSHFGTAKSAHAETVKRSEIRPDLKWQTQLDPNAAQAVATNSDVVSYLAELGLCCGDQGLVAAKF